MVFDIGMPNIAVNPLDGAFEIVKHKKDNETRSIFWDLKGELERARQSKRQGQRSIEIAGIMVSLFEQNPNKNLNK